MRCNPANLRSTLEIYTVEIARYPDQTVDSQQPVALIHNLTWHALQTEGLTVDNVSDNVMS